MGYTPEKVKELLLLMLFLRIQKGFRYKWYDFIQTAYRRSARSRLKRSTGAFVGFHPNRRLPIHPDHRVFRIIRAVLNNFSIPKLVQHSDL